MKLARVLMFAAALPWLGGCESVWTPEPLGAEPVVLDESWSGAWLVEDGVVHTAVQDAARGRLQLAWVETGGPGAALETLEGTVRRGAGLVFFNVKDDESAHGYYWAVIDQRPGRILIWHPDPDAFVEAVAQGRVPGREIEGSVVLGALSAEQLALLGDPSANLLKWREPLVMVRLGAD